MKKYEYSIKINEISLLLGIYRYAGMVNYIFLVSEKTPNLKVEFDFGETYGETKDIAYVKMKEKVEKWIENNQD